MMIFLILEHAIAKWYSYQPSIIISNPSPSVIHHLQLSIMFSHPSSSNIDHLQASVIITSSIIFSHPSSSNIDHPSSSPNIDHHQASIIITSRSSWVIHHNHISIIFKESIIITYRSSSVIHHHQKSIIISHLSSDESKITLIDYYFPHFIARNDRLIHDESNWSSVQD